MIKGLNNKLSNVPTITGLSDIVADTVTTDDLVINGIDVGTAITDLQQLTTGITYDSLSDTTTVDNNVIMTKTLNVTDTVTAPTFDGMATYMKVYEAANSYFYAPAFVVGNVGPQWVYRSTTIPGIIPLGINPSAGQLRANILQAANSAGGSVVIRAFNTQSVSIGVGTQPLPLANATSGDFNVGIGYCLRSITEGSNNFAMGYNCALNLKRSSNNCLMGHRAGLVLNFSNTITAYSNVCVGDTALTNADEIQHCCAVGAETGLDVLNGNVFCTMIGNRANVSNGLSYATAIGGFATCTTSNTVQLGRTADNVNCPNTISVASTATMGNLVSANTQIQGADSLAGIFRNTTGGVQRSVRIIPNSLNGEYNWIQQDGDAFLYAQGASANAQALALSIWSSITSGIRISPTALRMGWGGSSSTPTHMLTFDVSGAYFNTAPKTTVEPSNGDDLCNKTYVDGKVVASSPSNITATYYTDPVLQYPVFVEQTGSQQVRIDFGLNFNPSTNTLSCTQFNGILAGTATQADVAAQVTLSNNASGASNYLVMSETRLGTSTLRTDPSGATYDSTTNTAVMNITGNAVTATVTGTDASGLYYPVFSGGSGAQSLFIDPTDTTFTYNPSTALLSVRALATVGNIAGRTGTTSLALSSIAGNTTNLLIRHNDTSSTANIIIHTALGGSASVILRTNGVSGKGLTITNDGATTFDYPEIFLKPYTGAPSLGLFGFGASPVDGTNIVSGYNACRATFTANGNNTLYGANIGTLMNTTTKNNTVIGFNSGNQLTSGGSNTLVGSNVGALITTGIENVAIGQGALSSNIGGTDNVCIGFNAGSNITGSNNVCIGSGVTVPTAAGNNQVVLGGSLDTVFVRGSFRYSVGLQLTTSRTLPEAGTVLANFYTVNVSTAGQTFTLPDPTSYAGHMITFKRKASNVQYTLASGGGGTRFIPFNSITASATLTVTTAIFQQIIICDGLTWNVVSHT